MSHQLGLFDSSLGGLTVLRRLIESYGPISCLYLGDTARVPYGNRSATEIRSIADEVVSWLRKEKVSAVVMACNTTNALARDVAERAAAGLPVFGLIESVAGQVSVSRVGVLATPATAASGAYTRAIQRTCFEINIFEQPCPAFVPMIEAGDLASSALRQAAVSYLRPLLKQQVREIILGCTHYPLIEPLLHQLLPPDIRLLDPARALARDLDCFLGTPLRSRTCRGLLTLQSTRLCVTADPEGFAERTVRWLGIRPHVELVSLRPSACAF